MKSLKLTQLGLYTALFTALLFSATSCKKSSNSSSSHAGSVTFNWNGKSVNMSGTLDTLMNFTFTAAGVLPGTQDTSIFNIVIPNAASRPAYTLTGFYSDTTTSGFDNTASFSLIEVVTDMAYQDNYLSNQPFGITVTSNNGSSLSATFSGMVYLVNGSGTDSLMISNGHLSVNY